MNLLRKAYSAAVALSTCAFVAQAQAPKLQPLPPSVTIDTMNAVTVQNDRKVPVTVYLERGQFDQRLGEVPAQRTAVLPIPGWAVREHLAVKIAAHPEGADEDLETQTISLMAPARLGMVIPATGDMPTPSDTMSEVIPPEELADATLTVDNPRDEAVTVYAEHGLFDVRLGRVPPHGRVTLPFPKSVVLPTNTLEIFVHPDGGFDLASEKLTVKPGAHLGLRVPKY